MFKKLYISFLVLLSMYSFLSRVEAQIVCLDAPANDLCEDAIHIGKTAIQGTTCCAFLEGLSLCSNSESGVWFHYVQSLSASLVKVENISISGGIGVEIYAGSCDNLTLLQKSDCSGFSNRNFEVPNCSGEIFIHITSTESGCGEFAISVEDIAGCEFADNCDDITDALTMHPVADGAQVCVSSCMDYSCLSTCTDASVWFKFHTDDLTTAVQLQVNNLDFIPMISVYRGNNCTDFDDLLLCETVSPGAFTDLAVTPDFTYFVEVSLASGMPGDFELCVSAIQDYIECSSGILTVTRPENPDGNPVGPYCPGETVLFCYDLQFYVDTPDQGNGCQWLQGIVPVLGGGWDLNEDRLEDQNPLNWFWFDDVHYNVDSPVLALGTDPNGNKTLEYGPGGLRSGDVLPGGWYFVSNGTNSGCTNDGHPDNMWGVNFPCGQVYNFSHCFQLTTKSVTDIEDCEDEFSRDLSVTIFNFADGETGCYTSLACSGDTPVRFEGELDCSNLVDIMAPDNIEICSGDFAEIPVEISGGYEIPIIVEVLDEGNTRGANDWIFETGSGLIPDQIINRGDDIETITYRVSFHEPESVCNTPSLEFSVLVYPDFELDMQDLHVLCEGESKLLSAPAAHDEYGWYNAETNEFLSDSRHYRVEKSGFYRIEVTEDLCTKSQIIEVQFSERLPLALDTEEIDVCNKFIGTLPANLDLNAFLINGVMGSWYDQNGFPILDPSNIDFSGRNPASLTFEFQTTSAPEPCPDTLYTFQINIEDCDCPPINIQAPPDFCAENQLIKLSDLLSEADPGSWSITSGPAPESIIISGSDMSIDSDVPQGTYGLSYILDDPNVPPLCPRDTTVFFNVYQKPVADITDNVTVCNIYTGTFQDTLVLDGLNLSSSSGMWSADDPEIEIVDNMISFIDVDPGLYDLMFVTDDAIAPCENNSYPLSLEVLDCSCPDVSLASLGDYCIDEIELNLEDYQLSDEPGEWSVVNGPDMTNISIQNSSLKINSSIEEGMYTLRFTLDSDDIPPLCDEFAEISFNLFSEPFADISPFAEACNEDTGTLPDFVDLDDYNLNNAQGSWSSLDPGIAINSTDNTVEFVSKEIRTYDFFFNTDSAVPPCEDQQYQLVIELLDCSCPSVELAPMDKLCLEEQSINLTELKITEEAGFWSISSSGPLDGVEVVGEELRIFENAQAGVYSLNFELEDQAIGPDCPVSASVEFLLIEKPSARIEGNPLSCNAPDGDEPYILDLDDYNLDDDSGLWTSIDPGLNIDADNMVSFEGLSPGIYSFSFMTDTAEAPCDDQLYSLDVNVIDCLCPSLVFEPLANFCQEAQVFDLNTLVIEADPGSWSIVSGNGNRPEVQGSELIISDNTSPGSYELMYELLDTNVPQGCAINHLITFKVFELPKAEIQPYAEVCNAYIGSLDTIVRLNDMHVNGDFGRWESLDPSIEIEAFNVVNFSGVPEGEYTFVYTTNTAFPPCVNAVYELQVTVIACECPLIEINPFPDMCSDEQSIVLNQYINADMPGEWSIINGPAMQEIEIESNEILLFDSDIGAGTYTIQYEFTGEVPSLCSTLVQAEFDIIELPSVDIVASFTACNSEDSGSAPTQVDLDEFVSGSDGH